jgi:hypothetical protein
MEPETLFVIFAPGLGGNHLANLLSLTPRFYRTVDFEAYNSIGANAHFSNIKNLQLTSISDHIVPLTGVSNVLCGHLGEYIWLKQSGIAEKFRNKKFLIVSIPKKNTLAYRRLCRSFPMIDANEYFYQEQRTLYSQEIIEKIFDEHDFFNISAEIIFSDDINKLLTFIQHEFYTTIDVVQATKAHRAWINKIKEIFN